jgi:hypothetical protein
VMVSAPAGIAAMHDNRDADSIPNARFLMVSASDYVNW